MASIHKERRSGRTYYRLQFYDKDNRRRSIRLGTISRKAADTIRANVEDLVSASISGGSPDNKAGRWVREEIGQDLADKLANAGLIASRESATLAEFIDGYIASRTDAKPSTICNLRNSREKLVSYFGPDRNWRDIKPGDADDWRQSLVNRGLAEATVSKAVKHAKQYGRRAQRKGLIAESPFQDLVAGSQSNDSRLQFIDGSTIEKVIDAAPDVQWRLIIALSRYGGLRCPSETLALKWADIDWEARRITVPSTKTERQGKPYRILPLFPELVAPLREAWEQAPEGTIHVITRYQGSNTNLRTQMLRIIRRAGVQPWPRLFHNLRASRQTELTNDYPTHVVADWLGNSPAIAQRHYLQTTEEHFQRAAGGATVGAVVVQESVPQAAVPSRTEQQETPQPVVGCDVTPLGASLCDTAQDCLVPPGGLEPPTL